MALGERPGRHSRHPSRIATSSTTEEATTHARQPSLGSKDAATINYIKRTLCAKPSSGTKTDGPDDSIDSIPLEELLPPLTSSNEIDIQLYAILAVILSQFVQSWYNRITPDADFVGEIVQIVAHCTRGIEERLRSVDLLSLLFDELPERLNDHFFGNK